MLHTARWYDSVRSAPVIRRCCRLMSAAQTARRRGIKGDRSDLYLDPTDDLAMVKCRDDSRCECARWPRGHNSETLPVKQPRTLAGVRMMPQAATGRRRNNRPSNRGTALYCHRGAERAALGYLFKRQAPRVRRVHADDAALAIVTVTG